MKLDTLAEGLADYAIECEERDAREDLIICATSASAPFDEDDFVAYARDQLRKATQRARAAGVFDDQPGEAEWLTMHRWERVDLTMHRWERAEPT
jgi:hypothetical protein